MENVIDEIERLCDENILSPEAQDVVDYFVNTCIGRPQRHQYRRIP